MLRVSWCPELTTIPEDLGDLPALKELELSELDILPRLPPSLVRARGLEKLTMFDCPKVVPLEGLLELPSLDEESRDNLRCAFRQGGWPSWRTSN